MFSVNQCVLRKLVLQNVSCCFRGGNVLVADFGTLRVDSELQPKDVSLEVSYGFLGFIY